MLYVKYLFHCFIFYSSVKFLPLRFDPLGQLYGLIKTYIEFCLNLSTFDVMHGRYDKDMGRVSGLAAYKIMHPEWFDNALSEGWEEKPPYKKSELLDILRKNYAQNRAKVDVLVQRAVSNPRINKWLKIHLQIERLHSLLHGDSGQTKYRDNQLRELCIKPKFITEEEIKNLLFEVKRDIKEVKRDLKTAYSDLLNKKVFKIPLNFKFFGTIIPILSAMFLISGFLYTYIVYRFFGVPISIYFFVSDYISSSVEQIYSVFLTFSITLVFVFYFYRKRLWRLSKIELLEKEKGYKYLLKELKKFKVYSIPVLVCSVLFFVGLLGGGRTLHATMSGVIVIIGWSSAPHLALLFFTKFIHALFLLALMFAYIGIMYATVYGSIYDVLERKSVSRLCDQVIISFDNDENSPSCGSPVIGATQAYVFIFDRDKKTTFVWSHSQKATQGIYKSNLYDDHPLHRLSDWVRNLVLSEEILDKYKTNKDRREGRVKPIPGTPAPENGEDQN